MKDNTPPDLIGRNFFALEPYKRLVCDITYLTGTDTTWYLSAIEDLFNGEVLAWKIGEHCNTQLVIETVEMLKQNVGNLEGCILHSDAGSTYTAYAYRELLLSFGIKQSMGKKRTCFDNARIESFNGVFKTEALYSKHLLLFRQRLIFPFLKSLPILYPCVYDCGSVCTSQIIVEWRPQGILILQKIIQIHVFL